MHIVSFSPPGDVLAFAGEPILFLSIHVVLNMLPDRGRDNTIGAVYPSAVRAVGMTALPLVTPVWTSEDSTVAVDHDCRPCVFYGNESGWRLIGGLNRTSAPKSVFAPFLISPVGTRRLNSAAFSTSSTRILGVSRAPVEVGAFNENPSCVRSTRTRSRACDPTKGRAGQPPRSSKPESTGSWSLGTLER